MCDKESVYRSNIQILYSNLHRAISDYLDYGHTSGEVKYINAYTMAVLGAIAAYYSKDINLYCLHLLSILGFAKYILEPIVLKENPWIFRIKYITVHYAISGLKKLKAFFENDRQKNTNKLYQKITGVIASCDYLFVPKFRNCMMHYDLGADEAFTISDTNFDWNKVLFGLVEECFGVTYEICYDKLSEAATQIELCLSGLFNYGCLRIKRLE